ncbi:MAG: VOC family protein [Erythrobacter sp.]
MRAVGPIYQMAFVVSDLDAAIDRWVSDGAGPFWLFEDFCFAEVAEPQGAASPRFDIALGYFGNVNIELMQITEDPGGLFPASDLPQPHHVACLTSDLGAEIARLGQPVLLRGTFPTGQPAAFVDTRAVRGIITELIQVDEMVTGMLDTMQDAAKGWDGDEPRRRF